MRCDPGRLLGKMLGSRPDEWQQELLRSKEKRILLNCSRQSGKTSSAAAMALWSALYEPGSLVLIVAPGLRQAGELFRRVLAGYRLLGKPVRALSETRLSIELVNGSRCIAIPGNEAKIRTYSKVSLLIFEEAARVPNELYTTCRPMLAVSGGRLVALSTPYHQRGWYYEEWRARHEWDYWEVPATECGRISPEFLEEEQRKIGPYLYEENYLCMFHPSQDQVFSREMIDRCMNTDLETWDLDTPGFVPLGDEVYRARRQAKQQALQLAS
jgi:hypothetical protein